MVLAAVAQMTSTPSVAHNLATSIALIRRASALGAKMIFFPEATDFIAPSSEVFPLSRRLFKVSRKCNEFFYGISDAAKEHKIWVNLCVHESPYADPPTIFDMERMEALGKRCYNTNIVLSDEGLIFGLYRKMNLFDVDLAPAGPTIRESDTTIPGKTIPAPIPETPVGNLGLQTCFDLRFPSASQQLLSDPKWPAHSLTFPSAFALHTGAAHWETLLRARAIEGQCYVFASAQTGEHYPGRRSYGHAMIIDPWGTVVAQCPQTSQPEICIADVDLSRVAQIRREMPMGRR